MAITIHCVDCAKKWQLREDVAGKRIKCPSCGKALAVSAAGLPGKQGKPSRGTSAAVHKAEVKAASRSLTFMRWPWLVGGLCALAL